MFVMSMNIIIYFDTRARKYTQPQLYTLYILLCYLEQNIPIKSIRKAIQVCVHTNKDRETDRQTDRQRERQRHRERQTDKQTETETQRETDRQTERQRQRDREKVQCFGIRVYAIEFCKSNTLK